MRFLDFSTVIYLNRFLIEKYGGDFLEPDNLHWVLDVVQYSVFGIERYPTIFDKAAIIAWIIIVGHVFTDGNKRTAFVASTVFLLENGFELIVTKEEIINTFESVATHKTTGITFELLSDWFSYHSVKIVSTD